MLPIRRVVLLAVAVLASSSAFLVRPLFSQNVSVASTGVVAAVANVAVAVAKPDSAVESAEARYERLMASASSVLRSARSVIAEAVAAYEARAVAQADSARAAAARAAAAADSIRAPVFDKKAIVVGKGKAVVKTATVMDSIKAPVFIKRASAVDTVKAAAVGTDTAGVADSSAARVAVADSAGVADTAVAVQAAVGDTVSVDTAAAAPAVVVAPPPPPPPPPPKLYPIGKPDIEMVFVKGGKFRMGCQSYDNACLGDERPIHEVSVGNFLIGKYPVTQKQWKAVMGVNPSNFDGDSLPVEQISWGEVQEFIKRLNAMTGKKYRLPTEAEWEYAAYGGASRKGAVFSGHRFLDDVAWYNYNSYGKTQPVGKKLPNEIGVYDMVGNVWEWVADRYDKYYYRESPVKNPSGPRYGDACVYRGGGFNSGEEHSRVSLRNYGKPGHRAIDLGFRLACAP